jgi:hypothetical protein
MKCLKCGKEQHYYTSCDPVLYLDNGYCSDKCQDIDMEREAFNIFMCKLLVSHTGLQNETIKESEQDLWESWITCLQKYKYGE